MAEYSELQLLMNSRVNNGVYLVKAMRFLRTATHISRKFYATNFEQDLPLSTQSNFLLEAVKTVSDNKEPHKVAIYHLHALMDLGILTRVEENYIFSGDRHLCYTYYMSEDAFLWYKNLVETEANQYIETKPYTKVAAQLKELMGDIKELHEDENYSKVTNLVNNYDKIKELAKDLPLDEKIDINSDMNLDIPKHFNDDIIFAKLLVKYPFLNEFLDSITEYNNNTQTLSEKVIFRPHSKIYKRHKSDSNLLRKVSVRAYSPGITGMHSYKKHNEKGLVKSLDQRCAEDLQAESVDKLRYYDMNASIYRVTRLVNTGKFECGSSDVYFEFYLKLNNIDFTEVNPIIHDHYADIRSEFKRVCNILYFSTSQVKHAVEYILRDNNKLCNFTFDQVLNLRQIIKDYCGGKLIKSKVFMYESMFYFYIRQAMFNLYHVRSICNYDELILRDGDLTLSQLKHCYEVGIKKFCEVIGKSEFSIKLSSLKSGRYHKISEDEFKFIEGFARLS